MNRVDNSYKENDCEEKSSVKGCFCCCEGNTSNKDRLNNYNLKYLKNKGIAYNS